MWQMYYKAKKKIKKHQEFLKNFSIIYIYQTYFKKLSGILPGWRMWAQKAVKSTNKSQHKQGRQHVLRTKLDILYIIDVEL